MNILGIDPGQTGGLVLLGPSGSVMSKSVMPVRKDNELDKNELLDILVEWHTWDDFHIFFERIIPFAMSAKGALAFGRQLGMLEYIFWQKEYKTTFVEAAKWTRVMHQGIDANLKPKVRSLIAVERLFPGVNLKATDKCKKDHDGLVDALLIAEYGRRTLK